ncbi:M20/M25/M40 family metallo-hydrolase [Dielma fastidiosa]|uniref:M20/M25/M40 family metallo-hydrolase n=1 Tax=Dielma fastidiosa TaxID=1034346 RepID=UPI00356706D0
MLSENCLAFIEQHENDLLQLIETLCGICAPSNQEHQRTVFVEQWLKKQGCEHVKVDEAGNVLYFYQCKEHERWMLGAAHMDTVFPDLEPMPFSIEGNLMKCPGVGDDTANLAVLMMCAKYLAEYKPAMKQGLLLAADTGEEGLGNLKGCKQILKDYGNRIDQVLALDGTYEEAVNKAVGSLRYKVKVKTEGGHSYGCFGNRNAIHQLASLINVLYAYKVPTTSKTTYNVGSISGGTSINTIAQSAEMLFEIRSDCQADMAACDAYFHCAVKTLVANGAEIEVQLLGERPCMGDVDKEKQQALEAWAKTLIQSYTNKEINFQSGSTDCNIPFSMGIPSICFGAYLGDGAHTREEAIEIDSLKIGFKLGMEALLKEIKQ